MRSGSLMPPEEIKELRQNLQLTLQEFAVKLNVALNTVYRWETGKAKPSPLALEKLERLKGEGDR